MTNKSSYIQAIEEIERSLKLNEDDDYTYIANYFDYLKDEISNQTSEIKKLSFKLLKESLAKNAFTDIDDTITSRTLYQILFEFSYEGFDLTELDYPELKNVLRCIKKIQTNNFKEMDSFLLEFSLTIFIIYNYAYLNEKPLLKYKESVYLQIKKVFEANISSDEFKEMLLESFLIRDKKFKERAKNNQPSTLFFLKFSNQIRLLISKCKVITDDYSKLAIYLMDGFVKDLDSVCLFHELIAKYQEPLLELTENEIIKSITPDLRVLLKEFKEMSKHKNLTPAEREEQLAGYLLEKQI